MVCRMYIGRGIHPSMGDLKIPELMNSPVPVGYCMEQMNMPQVFDT